MQCQGKTKQGVRLKRGYMSSTGTATPGSTRGEAGVHACDARADELHRCVISTRVRRSRQRPVVVWGAGPPGVGGAAGGRRRLGDV